MPLQSVFRNAATKSDAIAIVDDTGSYSFAQVARMTAGLGGYLATQTTRPRVGILLPPGAAFSAAFHGCLLAGKASVPINYLLGPRETAHIVADSAIDTVVTVGPLAERLAGTGLNVIDVMTLAAKLQAAPPAAAPVIPTLAAGTDATMLYTSGTSGLPKGVPLTVGNLMSSVLAAEEHTRINGTHNFLGVVPLFHSTGLMVTLLMPTHLGAKVVYQSRFNPTAVITAIREQQLSVVTMVPSMYGAILRLKNAEASDFASVKYCVSGGEPLSPVIRQAFEQRFGVHLLEGYGLTETIGPLAFNVPWANRPGAVGTLLPGVNVRIVDDAGQPLASGATGEILVAGPIVMGGYHQLPNDSSAALTPDGYFRTGDLGHLDADGYLHITGRKKDLIIVGGEKVYPREIEDLIAVHPRVAEVAVIGRKDPLRGEAVVAYIAARDGMSISADEIRTFCREQGLMNWKTPRDVFVLSELPKSPTGKVLKRQLAEKSA
jgi:long-chain acyl-CoA synthetase